MMGLAPGDYELAVPGGSYALSLPDGSAEARNLAAEDSMTMGAQGVPQVVIQYHAAGSGGG